MAIDFAEFVRKNQQWFPDRTALVCEEQRWSYRDLWDSACRLANALSALGMSPQDRVATLSGNNGELVVQSVALAVGNFVRATLYTYNAAELNARLLEVIGAKALIVEAGHYEAIAPYLSLAPSLEHVIVYGADSAPEGTLNYSALLAQADAFDPHIRAAGSDVHVIRFSGGTTGFPKAMYHTVDAWLGYCNEHRWIAPPMTEEDRFLAVTHMAHLSLAYLWPTLATGGTVIVMPQFEPEKVLELIEREKVSFATMVPTMIQRIVDHPSAASYDLSTLRCVLYSGAPISETTLGRAINLFGDVLHQMYGQSEVGPVAMLRPDHHRVTAPDGTPRLRRSAGRATPSTILRIVDDNGNDLPIGQVGEVAAWSPGRVSGFWQDDKTFQERLLPDGSILTSDMGFLDADGFLFLADRRQDMIVSGGYNIWPAELENALSAHPAVAEACVVARPSTEWGETPHADVVLRPGHTVEPSELIEWTRDKVGPVKKVASVEFVAALPKSAAGKLLRREVKERFWSGHDTRVAGS
ncbi:class I adenylate-forming enzyme family protein [bacterium RCC_150]